MRTLALLSVLALSLGAIAACGDDGTSAPLDASTGGTEMVTATEMATEMVTAMAGPWRAESRRWVGRW